MSTSKDFSKSVAGAQVLGDIADLKAGLGSGVTKASIGLGNVDNTHDSEKPVSTAQAAAINAKLSKNTAIVSASKTKITFDANGLVTAGADATTADIADSLDRRYVTDAEKVKINNASTGGGVTLGETATTAYQGDRGKTAFDHSQITGANPHGTTTSTINEGTNKYFTETRVLAAVLAGFATGTNSAVLASDQTITAFGKLQTQINNIVAAGGGAVTSVSGKTGAVTLTSTDVGLQNVPNTDATQRANHSGTQGLATISGITATRLLGRASAGFGAAEEIILGTGLSFSGSTLNAAPGGSSTTAANMSLTGLTTGTAAAIAAADNVLQAFAKTEYRVAIIESEFINVKRSMASGATDITTALDAAITTVNQSNAKGGQIYIPPGAWTTNGGHVYPEAAMIMGAGNGLFENGTGTNISLNPAGVGVSNFVFKMNGNTQNIKLSDLAISLRNRQTDGIGFYVTGTTGNYHLKTVIERVSFFGGRYNIKVESDTVINPTTGLSEQTHLQFEGFSCLHSTFFGGRTAFYNNSLNGSVYFFHPHIAVPSIDTPNGFATGGIAFELKYTGTFVAEKYHIIGGGNAAAYAPSSDGTTLLYTFGAFNRIVLREGQDEKIDKYYTNDTNPYQSHPIELYSNQIQSRVVVNSNASIVSNSCSYVNAVRDDANFGSTFYDTANGFLTLKKVGINSLETRTRTDGAPVSDTRRGLTYLKNPLSKVIDGSGNVTKPGSLGVPELIDSGVVNRLITAPAPATSGNTNTKSINANRGVLSIASGATFATVYNTLVDANSVITAAALSSGGAVDYVAPGAGYFAIYLKAAATAEFKCLFRLEYDPGDYES